MVRINKIYTKTGDKGTTRLVGGNPIPKNHPRVEAYGTIDELNSIVGIVRYFNNQRPQSLKQKKFDVILEEIQQRLFDLGSQLATDPNYKSEMPNPPQISKKQIEWLEQVIDAMNENLKPLNSFILPGGSALNSFLHQCRTVCRRAERKIITLNQQEDISPEIIAFVNRLSDAFFVFNRWLSQTQNEEEVLWKPNISEEPDWKWE